MRQPWLNPEETVEALEIMNAAAEAFRHTATYGTMRKELRRNLETHACNIEEFVRRVHRGVVDPALVLALDEIAAQEKRNAADLVAEALEIFISTHNRKR